MASQSDDTKKLRPTDLPGEPNPARNPSVHGGNGESTLPLEKRSDRFQLLMESVKDYAIFMLDLGGKVVTWNRGAEQILGYQKIEILGRHFCCLFSREEIEAQVPESLLETAQENARAERDGWQLRKDGTRLWANSIITPLLDATVRGHSVVLRDVSSQKAHQDALRDSDERHRRRSEQLEELNQRKDKFLALVSHELRNPLAPMLTALHVLRQEPTENPLQLQTCTILDRQVRQLSRLVDDLLEAARLTAGKFQLRHELVELRTAIERAMETARPFIDEGKHEFVLSLPKHPIWLRADPARLEQILLNLLNNAAKYTTDGGQIRLTAERQGSDVVVTVKDNGVGIAADMLDRIFEMFAQVDRSLEQAHGGLGIGLAVVKRLVEMHGGSIHVHSDGPGCGSEFAVRLPIRVESSPGRPQMIDANISSSCKLRILIVDDNKDGARMLSLLLQRMGNEICVAHDGLEGLESARDFGPDVVLLDIGLPTLDGYEVAKRIRAEPCGQTAVLIAVTGWAREEDRQRTKEAGFNHYLLKPVEPSLLQKLLATVKPKDSRELAGDQKS